MEPQGHSSITKAHSFCSIIKSRRHKTSAFVFLAPHFFSDPGTFLKRAPKNGPRAREAPREPRGNRRERRRDGPRYREAPHARPVALARDRRGARRSADRRVGRVSRTALFARDADRVYVLDPAKAKLLVFAGTAAPSVHDVALAAGVWELKSGSSTGGSTETVALVLLVSVAAVAFGIWAYFTATKKRGPKRLPRN